MRTWSDHFVFAASGVEVGFGARRAQLRFVWVCQRRNEAMSITPVGAAFGLVKPNAGGSLSAQVTASDASEQPSLASPTATNRSCPALVRRNSPSIACPPPSLPPPHSHEPLPLYPRDKAQSLCATRRGIGNVWPEADSRQGRVT
jgi:hypothetical protein